MARKTIIITGVSSGLGKALFDTLQSTDVRLICISRTFPDYQKALSGKDVILLTCDLSKQEKVSELIRELDSLLENTDDVVFVNNAATIAPIGSIGELDEASLIAAVYTNFISPVFITNALCALKNAKKFAFIHISTGAARIPIVGWSLYCSTKAACKMFFAVLEEQCKGDDRISVHQFDPGVIDTPMQDQIRQSSSKDFPRVEEFKTLKKTQELSDPILVAKKLVEQCIPI